MKQDSQVVGSTQRSAHPPHGACWHVDAFGTSKECVPVGLWLMEVPPQLPVWGMPASAAWHGERSGELGYSGATDHAQVAWVGRSSRFTVQLCTFSWQFPPELSFMKGTRN